jgi:pilus assembly protein CpaE
VLVDGSLQFGDTAVTLDLQPTHTIFDLMDHVEEMDHALVESVLTPHSGGIKVLLAPPRPEMAEYVTAANLQRVLEQLKRQFDYVFVDTWTSLHDTVLTVLDVADLILLVTTPDIPSLRNVRLFLEVTEQLDYPPEKLALVLNKSDPRRSRIRASDIEENIKHPVTAELPLDELVSVSVNQGVPFVLSDGSRPISQAVGRMVDKLVEMWAVAAEEEAAAVDPMDEAARKKLGRFFR